MPDPSNDDITKETTRIKAQVDLIKAQTEQAKAQAELAQATKPADPAALADAAEKARLQRQKDLLEARKAVADATKAADQAAAQAAVGTVAKSGIEGTVQVKPDAGKGEATLLAARGLQTAAARIAGDLKKANIQKVVLTPSGSHVQFPGYRQYLLQFESLSQQFDRAEALIKSAAGTEETPRTPFESLPLVTVAGVAIDAIANLGSYFLSNYEIGGITLNPDIDQLIGALAGALVRIDIKTVLPDRRIPGQAELAGLLGTLPKRMTEMESLIAQLSARMPTRQSADAEADQTKKQQLMQAIARGEEAIAVGKSVLAKAVEFTASLIVPDSKGILLVTKVAQEKAICDELKSGTDLLVVDVRAMVGSYYTKKNLWTFLGGVPFFAMGGAVVTYQLLDADGTVNAAGLVPIHSGYRRCQDVEALMNTPAP